MRKLLFVLPLVLLAAVLLAGCLAPDTPLTPRGNSFTYENADNFRPDGLGIWRLEVTDAGMFSMRYSVRDFIESFAPQPLAPAAREELWQRILACNFPGRPSSDRAGQFGEQLIVFTLQYNGRNHYCKIFASDARLDPALVALLDTLTELVRARSNRPAQLY